LAFIVRIYHDAQSYECKKVKFSYCDTEAESKHVPDEKWVEYTKQGPVGAVFTNSKARAIENGEVLLQNAERLVSRTARVEDQSYYVTKRIVSWCLCSHRQRR